MKKVLSAVLACVLVLGMMFTLVSCGKKLSGAYEAEVDIALASYEVTYDFSGSKVEVTRKSTLLGASFEPVVINGTYEIAEDEEGKLTITFEYEGKEDEVVKGGTFAFEEGEDYIKIGLVKYEKAE